MHGNMALMRTDDWKNIIDENYNAVIIACYNNDDEKEFELLIEKTVRNKNKVYMMDKWI